MLVVCGRWVRDGDRLLHIDPKFFWPLQHFFFILARVAQPWVIEGRKHSVCKLILTLASCPPTDSNSNWNWPKPSVAPGYIIVWHPPASAVPTLIYTGASLDWRLGRGSIYNTQTPKKGYPGYDTKLHMIVRLQFIRSEKREESLQCHYFQVYSE